MNSIAVILREPEHLALGPVELAAPGEDDVIVDVSWSGISTGTERLLWTGRMPHFPGMGYPLVPGYESVGRVSQAARSSGLREGDMVFVPGSKGFVGVRGLFGGAASRVVLPAARAVPLSDDLGEQGVLLALAATGYHALGQPQAPLPGLIIGHGVLGRLIARLCVALGGEPVVWETNPARRAGATGYSVVDPADDARKDYPVVCDVSGDSGLLDTLIGRIARGGEVVLAGFYEKPLSFAFPPAFMREARLRVAAEWHPDDLVAVRRLIDDGRLSLDDLVTHRSAAADAASAYRTAFTDPSCLKMVLDWSIAS
ncbi:MAG: chlorophyll synthesis pathway protein BchC [Alphaproteobacteria bacterium]